MKDSHYRALLDLMMCSDPFPQDVNREEVENLMDEEALERGFDHWIDAYHQFNPNPDPPVDDFVRRMTEGHNQGKENG